MRCGGRLRVSMALRAIETQGPQLQPKGSSSCLLLFPAPAPDVGKAAVELSAALMTASAEERPTPSDMYTHRMTTLVSHGNVYASVGSRIDHGDRSSMHHVYPGRFDSQTAGVWPMRARESKQVANGKKLRTVANQTRGELDSVEGVARWWCGLASLFPPMNVGLGPIMPSSMGRKGAASCMIAALSSPSSAAVGCSRRSPTHSTRMQEDTEPTAEEDSARMQEGSEPEAEEDSTRMQEDTEPTAEEDSAALAVLGTPTRPTGVARRSVRLSAHRCRQHLSQILAEEMATDPPTEYPVPDLTDDLETQ
eukprot:scaffold110_cov247-Pinguiococcus_pyrenoidosus.AAC.1